MLRSPRTQPTSANLKAWREELELFFWAANRLVWLVFSVAMLVYAIVEMFHGLSPLDLERLMPPQPGI